MRYLELGSHRFTRIIVEDVAGAGNANHEYRIESIPDTHETHEPLIGVFAHISFQKGPIAEAGVNGAYHEDLLAIVIDRLQCFQKGEFSCRENALAITKLEEAMHWLNHRTKDRQDRKVEGTSSA